MPNLPIKALAFVIAILFSFFYIYTQANSAVGLTSRTVSNEPNKAAVIIDTGSEVRKVCITFNSDSISGEEALRLANAEPVFYSFNGIGKAVCSLCGVGCPPDQSCLTCAGSKFWNYFRAPHGSSNLSPSGVGASLTKVKNGDVEAWKFSSGARPANESFETICGVLPLKQDSVKSMNNVQQLRTAGNSKASDSSKAKSNVESNLDSKSTVATTAKVLGKQQMRASAALDPKERRSKAQNNDRNLLPVTGALIGFAGALYFGIKARNKLKNT